ncbi:MAG: glutamine synthetase, partial [Myxococcaceae bacterium]
MPRAAARVTRRPPRAPREVRSKADPVEPVMRWLADRGATQVKIAGVDVDGVLRGKYVSLDKFASVARAGLGFCDVVFG